MSVSIVVLDACILISLAQVNRFDITENLEGYNFFTTEHVLKEIMDKQQLALINTQISSGVLEVIKLVEPSTLKLYFQLKARIGSGEASCIAIAKEKHWLVCSDDKRKVPTLVEAHLGKGALLTIDGLLDLATKGKVLNIETADEIRKSLIEISEMQLAERVLDDL